MRRMKIENSWLGNLPLMGKVLLTVGSLLLLFILSSLGTSIVLKQERENRNASLRTTELLRNINQATRSIFQRQHELRQMLFFTGEPNSSSFELANASLDRYLDSIVAPGNIDLVQPLRIEQIQDMNKQWLDTSALPLISALRQAWQRDASVSVVERERIFQDFAARGSVKSQDIIEAMDRLADNVRLKLTERTQALIDVEDLRAKLLYGTLALALLCGLAALLLSARLITRPLNHLAQLMTRLSAHDHDIDIPQASRRDEIGVISRALVQFKKMAIETFDQNWIKTNSAAVSNRLQQVETHRDFGDALMAEISPLVNAGVALFYLYDSDTDRLYLTGSYGFKQLSGFDTSYKLGEGLVGQCAAQRKAILLEQVPADYLRVSSGIGEAAPRLLALFPIQSKDKLLAVMELGCLNTLDQRQTLLLDTLAPLVALTLENISRAVHTRQLLEQTQAQAGDLRSSEEELRTQQEELQASNEELRQKSDALNQQNSTLESLQRETEEKAEALTRANQYKSEFLANMSHELRTPLNSLLILSNDLAENSSGNLSDEQIESARIIHDSGTNLLRLINDILDLSKIEAGKMDLLLEQVDLQRFVANLQRTFKAVAREKQLEFTVAVDEGLPATLVGDSTKLAQIVSNLLSNAFKFTRVGTVGLRVGRPTRDSMEFPAAQTIAIEVSDTGIGIPPEKRLRIFGAFEQVDASTSRQFGGTGLGLTISRRLAQLHHGDIILDSNERQGSVFTVLLPQTPALPASLPEPMPAQSFTEAAQAGLPELSRLSPPQDDRDLLRPGDTCILLIEDDTDFARILIERIHRKGYRALAAVTGESGLELARRYKPNGILLDIQLPGMDGWAVLERIKQDPLIRHIPVHIVSALDESVRGREQGVAGFLTKPVTAAALNGAFERLLQFSTEGGRRLLVIDDDPVSRSAVRKLVGSDTVAIFEAGSAEEALTRLEGEKYDCIVLDLSLPGMSGFEFLDRLAAAKDTTPVVVYSARELSREDSLRIRQFTDSIVVKGERSQERLLDEVSLFLHSIHFPVQNAAAENGRDLAGRKILVVDDDMRNIFALSKVLRAKGMEVSLAQDGQKALEQLVQNEGIDLVLMDIMMPVMDGYETIREIRKNPKFATLPIISLTAKAMQGDREKSLQAGANDYLSKPIDTAKLLSMMRVWLHR